MLGWHRGPAFCGVERAKGGIEPIKGLIRQPPDPPQRVTGRDPLLDRHVGEQGAAALPVDLASGLGGCPIFPQDWFFSKLLILHADNGNAMRGATLESRLEEMGVLRSFSRPRVSNDNPYSESLFRTVKYRPDYPSRPFASKDEACEWVAAFVDWYNHRHHHSAIKFVTPHQRHSGSATAICQQRAVVYEAARLANPTRWSGAIRCWSQPAEVWINKPPEEPDQVLALPLIKAV